MSAPSCLESSIYNVIDYGVVACFNGTSAASPSAAGMAALLYQRGLAGSGAHLASLVKHLVTDLGIVGPDNVYGTGRITLPAPPPAAIDARPSLYTPLASPTRILDTRGDSATPGARVGPHPQFTILDLPVNLPGASAVAVSIVSVDSVAPGYVQALPTLMGRLADSSSLNVSTSTQIQPNFAIVPVGANGSITLYLYAGGNVVVDLLGSFSPSTTPTASAGRFVAVDPVRVLDTRPESNGPVPPEFTPHLPGVGETVRVTGIPAGASAAVVNVVADQATGSGFLRVQPTGATGLATSNGNYVAGLASGTLSIVPVGPDGTISVFTSNATHLVVDLMGYMTGPGAPASDVGMFVPLTPARAYDSRVVRRHSSIARHAARADDRIGHSRRRERGVDEPHVRRIGGTRLPHGVPRRPGAAHDLEPQLPGRRPSCERRHGAAAGQWHAEYPGEPDDACHHRRERLLHRNHVSDQLDTKTGWLDRDTLDNIRANIPLVYVDAVPVRVDERGVVSHVGMLLRQAADGSLSRMVVTGRVLFGERLRDALLRHLEKDLGPVALPQIPPNPAPFTVVEYFPDPDVSGFYDPRHHAVSMAYVVPVVGDCQPTQEALDLEWYTPIEAVSERVRREMTGGHDRLIRLALAHVGVLP